MKYQEKYAGSKEECFNNIKDTFTKLIKENLKVEDVKVKVPDDKMLVYKLKYEEDEVEGQLAVKITWSYLEEEEEEEEEELEL